MFSKKTHNEKSKIHSLIGDNVCLEGTIQFSGGLRIDGVVKGSLIATENTRGTLIISKSGRVEGRVIADHIIIDGEVVGEVKAIDTLDLQPNARVRGDVSYRMLEVHTGASIQGTMLLLSEEMDAQQEELDITKTTNNVTYLEGKI